MVHVKRQARAGTTRPAKNHEGWGASGRALESGPPEAARRAWAEADRGTKWARAAIGWPELRQKN